MLNTNPGDLVGEEVEYEEEGDEGELEAVHDEPPVRVPELPVVVLVPLRVVLPFGDRPDGGDAAHEGEEEEEELDRLGEFAVSQRQQQEEQGEDEGAEVHDGRHVVDVGLEEVKRDARFRRGGGEKQDFPTNIVPLEPHH